MPNGTVKWFNTTKGYGFIAPEDGGKDVFVHISSVEKSGLTGLADNQKVSFELQEGRDGRQMATDLSLLQLMLFALVSVKVSCRQLLLGDSVVVGHVAYKLLGIRSELVQRK